MKTMRPLRRFAVLLTLLSLFSTLALTAAANASPTLEGTTKAARFSSSLTLARPSQAAAGDVLVAAVNIRAHSWTPITAPSGWTLVRRDSTSGGREMSQAVYVRTVAAGEHSSYTWRFSTSVLATGAILAYGGVDTAQPIDGSSGRILSNTRRIEAPSVSASVVGGELVAFYATSGWATISAPSDLSRRVHFRFYSSGKVTSLAGADRVLANAGPTGDKVATSSVGGAVTLGQLVVLRPAGQQPAVPAPENVVAPAITGVAQVGRTLTATPGTWNGTQPIALAHQWQRSTGGSWASIAGATGATYLVASGDLDATIRVVVTATNPGGSTAVGSAPTAVVGTVSDPLAPEPGSQYLSDLDWTSATNLWGPVERDGSNGELGAGDGGSITLNGVVYGKGLGVHATSDIRFDLDEECTTFASDIGVDDEVGSAGNVTFQVWVDGTKAYDSGALGGSSATRTVRLDVTGAGELRLVVTPAGGAEYDHADWAGAWVVCSSSPPPSSGGDSSPPSGGGDPLPSASPSVPERFLTLQDGFGSASVQLYGGGSQILLQPQSGMPPALVTVGGTADSTHYARVRWEDVELSLGAELWVFGDFYLPSDFYERQQSYMRLLTLDNYNLDPSATRRLGFLLYGSDHLPRLMRQRAGSEEVELVRLSERLPTGRTFRLALHLVLSRVDGQALSEIFIDSQLVASTTRGNVSAGTHTDGSEPRFTRAGYGIDGAADQDSQTVELRMGNIGLSGSRATAGV